MIFFGCCFPYVINKKTILTHAAAVLFWNPLPVVLFYSGSLQNTFTISLFPADRGKELLPTRGGVPSHATSDGFSAHINHHGDILRTNSENGTPLFNPAHEAEIEKE